MMGKKLDGDLRGAANLAELRRWVGDRLRAVIGFLALPDGEQFVPGIFGSITGGNGSIYAVRRADYVGVLTALRDVRVDLPTGATIVSTRPVRPIQSAFSGSFGRETVGM